MVASFERIVPVFTSGALVPSASKVMPHFAHGWYEGGCAGVHCLVLLPLVLIFCEMQMPPAFAHGSDVWLNVVVGQPKIVCPVLGSVESRLCHNPLTPCQASKAQISVCTGFLLLAMALTLQCECEHSLTLLTKDSVKLLCTCRTPVSALPLVLSSDTGHALPSAFVIQEP